MKYLILSFIVFTSYQAFSQPCPNGNWSTDRENLKGSDFTRTDLRGVDFTWTKLQRSDFTGSDLRGADFTGSVLANTGLGFFWAWAIFTETNLEGALFPKKYLFVLSKEQQEQVIVTEACVD